MAAAWTMLFCAALGSATSQEALKSSATAPIADGRDVGVAQV